MRDRLYYSKISGNTDVAIVTKASTDCGFPSSGICIMFEVGSLDSQPAAIHEHLGMSCLQVTLVV